MFTWFYIDMNWYVSFSIQMGLSDIEMINVNMNTNGINMDQCGC